MAVFPEFGEGNFALVGGEGKSSAQVLIKALPQGAKEGAQLAAALAHVEQAEVLLDLQVLFVEHVQLHKVRIKLPIELSQA